MSAEVIAGLIAAALVGLALVLAVDRKRMAWPVRGTITDPFGTPRNYGPHNGMDIAAPQGTPVVAPLDGIVSAVGSNATSGNFVRIQHAGALETAYAHLFRVFVGKGETLRRGDEFAEVGSTGTSTGPHLHFVVRVNGEAVNPMNYLA